MGKKLIQATNNNKEWFVIPTAICAYSLDGDRVQFMLQNGVVMTADADNPDDFVKKSLRFRKSYEEYDDLIDSESAVDFNYGDLF